MKKKHSFSVLKKIASVLLAAMTILSVLMLSGCGTKATLDFKDLVTVKEINGINGSGYAVVIPDWDKAMALLGHLNSDSATSLLNTCEVNIENNGKLSNGDKLKVTVKTDENALKTAKVKAENTELEFDVSGLPVAIKESADFDANFDELKNLAEGKLNEEIARLTDESTDQWKGDVTKNDIAMALTNSTSVGSGIDVKIPKIENVEFTAAYIFNAAPDQVELDFQNNDYTYKSGQFFTVMLFTADASFTAKRDAAFLVSAIDMADTGKYIFAVCVKTPITSDGKITPNEVTMYKGGLSEESIIDDINKQYVYSIVDTDGTTKQKNIYDNVKVK